MKHPFNTLTKSDVQELRRKSVSVSNPSNAVVYNFTSADIDGAIKHLQTLYQGTIRASFAAKILLCNEIY